MSQTFKKHLRISLFVLLIVFFVSPQVSTNAWGKQPPLSGSASISPELKESLKSLQPNETVLIWVDVQAWVDRFGDRYLPADPALYGIRWIMVTFDPDIEQNNLFRVLAEAEAGRVEEISTISWVKNITLIKIGEYVRLSENPKLAMEGMGYAIQRAANEGNRSLELIVYVENLENVTALIKQLGGDVLRIGTYKNKLLARLPSQVIGNVTENPYVREIYHQGPIVPEGEAFPEKRDNKNTLYFFTDDIMSKLSYSVILGLVIDFVTASRKTRRRRLSLYVIAILSTVFLSTLLPSAKALDVSTPAIRATNVWDTGNSGAGVNVAVIDYGIDFNHPDFPPEAIRTSWNFPNNNATLAQDTHGHGTRVAGVIAGRGISINAYRGVAWEADLVVVRIITAFDLDDAIDWVRQNRTQYDIRVLSLSWAAPGTPTGEDGTSVYSQAVDNAVAAGIVVIKSAGNRGPGPRTITTPGDAFNVITVGASNDSFTTNIDDDTIPDFSSRGPTGDGRIKPDVVAPGVNIMMPALGGGYSSADGTSYAAPHVSGTAALILHEHPDWTPGSVKAAIMAHARLNTNLEGRDENDRGKGIVDAYNSVSERVTNLGFETGDSTGWPEMSYFWYGSNPPAPSWSIRYDRNKAHGAIYVGEWRGRCTQTYTGWIWANRSQPMDPDIRGGGSPIHFKGFVYFYYFTITDGSTFVAMGAYAAIKIEFTKDGGAQKWIYYVFMVPAPDSDPGHTGNEHDIIIETSCAEGIWYGTGTRNLYSDFQNAFGISLDETWRVSRISNILALYNIWTSLPDVGGPSITVWFDDISLRNEIYMLDVYVYDEATPPHPLQGMLVIVFDSSWEEKWRCYTDSQGYAHGVGLRAGSYRIDVSDPHPSVYMPQSRVIYMGSDREEHFHLKRYC